MSAPILATKLYIPPRRPDAVARARLINRLNDGLHRRLTLVCAPAGFGKTTLVSAWVAQAGRRTAWLSLEEADNDPARFLAYLAAALQTIVPDLGAGLFDASAPPAPSEPVLTALLNQIDAIPHSIILVLDDYHALDAPAIDAAVTFLVEHAPPTLHIVIATREDPRLPLARLRARGQVTDLRAADLRFSLPETAEFLNHVMRLGLTDPDIAALENRTEGWAAGLQLAALSVQGQADAAGFIRAFAGDNRHVVDYLTEEVLARQPEPVRQFLLRTAILDRMSGPLCDAVTGQGDGAARLEALERGGFFLVPLDASRRWYRYHHLFADVLHARLLAEQPDQVAALHARASLWHEAHGSPADAIQHALAARDAERAASLIERTAPVMRQTRQEAAMLGWLRSLPDETLRRRPVLSANFAGMLMLTGTTDGVEVHLRDAGRWLEPGVDRAGMRVTDEQEFQALEGMIAGYRAALALMQGDPGSTVLHANRAIALAPHGDHLRLGASKALVGLATWMMGHLRLASLMYNEAMTHLRAIGHLSDVLGCAVALADIRMAQGRPGDALRVCQQALQMAEDADAPTLRGTANLYVAMCEIERERDNRSAAAAHLDQAQKLGALAGLPQYPYRSRVALARLRLIDGEVNDALHLLDEAERLYDGDLSPDVRPVAALRARVWIAHGRLDDAAAWARERSLSASDSLSYLREYEHMTLARLLLARHGRGDTDTSMPAIVGFLERLLGAAETHDRSGSVIEALLLLALAHQAHGDDSAALVALDRALALAAPQGYMRLFADEGAPMARLLEMAAKHGVHPAYVRQLRAAFRTADGEKPVPAHGLADPLSQREMDVLRLLATDLDGPDIARTLIISLNTARTHIRNIYSKLGVSSRRAAIRRAEDFGLL
jgi:LuxR family transcriptional regulator, maltose regulon positive regulatory protein